MIEYFINYINTDAGLITIKVMIGLYILCPLFFNIFLRMRFFGESTAVPFLTGLGVGLIFIFFTPDPFFKFVIELLGMWIWAGILVAILVFPFVVARRIFRNNSRLRKFAVVLFFLFSLGLVIYSWQISRTSIAISWRTSFISLMVNNFLYSFIIFVLIIFGLYYFFIRN